MYTIKLDATDSTNRYLKNLMLSNSLEDLTVAVADKQTLGRGQSGTQWLSQPGKNLTFSILKKFDNFIIDHQFHLNMVVSLAILDSLKAFRIPNLKIKWPNDILSDRSKISGILIENMVKGHQIKASIIGIGLNVNQTDFNGLFNATSLKLLLGRSHDLDGVLNELLENLSNYLKRLESGRFIQLTRRYEEALFMLEEEGTFQGSDGKMFKGTIKGVTKTGRLQVAIGQGPLKEFDLKEIKPVY